MAGGPPRPVAQTHIKIGDPLFGTKLLAQDIAKHDSQYTPIPIKTLRKVHDRFLIIEDDVYHYITQHSTPNVKNINDSNQVFDLGFIL